VIPAEQQNPRLPYPDHESSYRALASVYRLKRHEIEDRADALRDILEDAAETWWQANQVAVTNIDSATFNRKVWAEGQPRAQRARRALADARDCLLETTPRPGCTLDGIVFTLRCLVPAPGGMLF